MFLDADLDLAFINVVIHLDYTTKITVLSIKFLPIVYEYYI